MKIKQAVIYGLSGVFLGLGIYFYLLKFHPEWEVVAVIDIGQVAQLSQSGQMGAVSQGGLAGLAVYNSKVESVDAAVVRLTSYGFLKDVARETNEEALLEILLPKKDGGKGGLTVKKGTELIQISVRAPTRELATKGAESVVNQLIERHDKIISKASVGLLEYGKAMDQEKEKFNIALEKLISARKPQLENVSIDVIENFKEGYNRSSVAEFNRIVVRQALEIPNTKRTTLIETPNKPTKPVFPRLLPSLFFGLISGLLFRALVNVIQ